MVFSVSPRLEPAVTPQSSDVLYGRTIEVSGLRHTKRDIVIRELASKIGEPYLPENAQRDRERLDRLGSSARFVFKRPPKENWWSTNVKAETRVGGIVDFTFVAVFNPDMKITTLEEPGLVAWECVAGHEPWANNTFRFELAESDGGTQLMFTQIYERELGDEAYGTYNFNWGYYLDSLRLYCETGTGKPFEPALS